MTVSRRFCYCLASLFLCSSPLTAADDGTGAGREAFPVYAFCFDTHDALKRDLTQQATMLKKIGFDGAGHIGFEGMSERLSSLDREDLKLFLAGINIDLRNSLDEQVEPLRQLMPLWKDRDLVLYVVLRGLPTEDPKGDVPAVAVLQKIADLAKQSRVRVGIYPHTSDWVARFSHAIRVAKKADRPNCGVIFNLCHWLRNEPVDTLDPLLEEAGPLLQGVTINGADLAGASDSNWNRLIQPLDQGNFDLKHLLAKLKGIGYSRPIGIMCYGIGGNAEEHLTRSLAAWRELQK